MGKYLDKAGKIAKNVGKGTALVLRALGEGVVAGCEAYEKVEHPEISAGLNLQTDVTLKAEDLAQLKGMTSYQLERVFRGKNVHLADDPAVYRELKNFSSFQLDAIFGKGGR